MPFKSAQFITSVVGEVPILQDGKAQVAFIGRSNVGKSSVINSLANNGKLAFASPTPGRTQTVNIYLVNKSFYLVDLPGYGFAKGSHEHRDKIMELVHWYLQRPAGAGQTVVLIVDAKVGPQENDLKMAQLLAANDRHVIIIANKIDKLKPTEAQKAVAAIRKSFQEAEAVIPYSATEKIGVGQLVKALTV
ncbi:MAG: ribosome biogenesis GTP-binding protein YsxC [Candidatus Doudnabacteria bacterium]|nr:ribosome biogenesis GTP-binding protein YsxC [Candidatus Doudnabacteria bacterium]